MSDTAPKRRWFRWSLRTLFVVMTMFALSIGLMMNHLNWIEERHAIRRERHLPHSIMVADAGYKPDQPRAQMLLWLFGEEGCNEVVVRFVVESEDQAGRPLQADENREFQRATRLFPEAVVNYEVIYNPTLRNLSIWFMEQNAIDQSTH